MSDQPMNDTNPPNQPNPPDPPNPPIPLDMSDSPDGSVPAPPPPPPSPRTVAPPTRPVSVQHRKRSSWPTVIGIIVLVLTALELFGGVCGTAGVVLSQFLSGPMDTMMQQGGQPGNPNGMPMTWDEMMPVSHGVLIVVQVIAMAVGVLGLIGAILLLNRKRKCVWMLMTYAAIKVLPSTAWTIWVGQQQFALSQKMIQAQGTAPPGMNSIVSAATWGGMALGILFQAGPGIFLIIWFMRKAIREEVKLWS
jgi:hypothetical protein